VRAGRVPGWQLSACAGREGAWLASGVPCRNPPCKARCTSRKAALAPRMYRTPARAPSPPAGLPGTHSGVRAAEGLELYPPELPDLELVGNPLGRLAHAGNMATGTYGTEVGSAALAEVEAVERAVRRFEEVAGRRPRVLIAKMGMDGHDRGAKVMATG
jgi:hypothetical protein